MNLTVQHAKSDTIADFTGTVTVHNSSGGTVSMLATDLVRPIDWNSSHNVTASIFASDITGLLAIGTGLTSSFGSGTPGTISIGAAGVGFFEPFVGMNTESTLTAPGIGTWYFDPIELPNGLQSGAMNVFMSNSAGFLNGAVFSAGAASQAGTANISGTFHNKLAFYQQGSGASVTRLESLWEGNASILWTWGRTVGTVGATSNVQVTNGLTISMPAQWDSAGGVTYSTTGQSGTVSSAATSMASTRADSLITGAVAYLSGARMDGVAFAKSLAPGQYWLGHMLSSSSASAGTSGAYTAGTQLSTHSRLGVVDFLANPYKRLGQSISNSSSQPQMFHGFLATTTLSASGVLATSDLRATTGRILWNQARSNF